jgi:ABC-type nitrate/sulfonate/bicarbonate transport system ATPase subunit
MDYCLKASSLSKTYNSLPVLQNWDIEIGRGERMAIIGPSGCGKTTFLNLVTQLELPTQGIIYTDCQRMGYVFQEPRLIPWKTVKQNLLFVQPDGRETEIINQLGLTGFENYYPSQLSGGMAQRINLARALMTDPDFLVLDEAFFALDLGTKYQIIQYLNDLWIKKQFTLISVTHDPKDALLLADRILIVSKRPSHIQEDYRVNHGTDLSVYSPDLLKEESELIIKILENK